MGNPDSIPSTEHTCGSPQETEQQLSVPDSEAARQRIDATREQVSRRVPGNAALSGAAGLPWHRTS